MKTSVRKAKSVVVVEDQTAICELIIEMLEARGAYRVLGSTADGNEGLALAKQLKPDILILDILLPGISGLEVLRQLHETQPDLKVLIFSAKSEKQIARGLLKAGVRGYVPKSARLSELRQAVDAVAAGEEDAGLAVGGGQGGGGPGAVEDAWGDAEAVLGDPAAGAFVEHHEARGLGCTDDAVGVVHAGAGVDVQVVAVDEDGAVGSVVGPDAGLLGEVEGPEDVGVGHGRGDGDG